MVWSETLPIVSQIQQQKKNKLIQKNLDDIYKISLIKRFFCFLLLLLLFLSILYLPISPFLSFHLSSLSLFFLSSPCVFLFSFPLCPSDFFSFSLSFFPLFSFSFPSVLLSLSSFLPASLFSPFLSVLSFSPYLSVLPTFSTFLSLSSPLHLSLNFPFSNSQLLPSSFSFSPRFQTFFLFNPLSFITKKIFTKSSLSSFPSRIHVYVSSNRRSVPTGTVSQALPVHLSRRYVLRCLLQLHISQPVLKKFMPD